MQANAFVDNAKVMAKGQITIPKDIREVLGVSSGDRVSFVVEGNTVRLVNSAVYAMQVLQSEMRGDAFDHHLVPSGDQCVYHQEHSDQFRFLGADYQVLW